VLYTDTNFGFSKRTLLTFSKKLSTKLFMVKNDVLISKSEICIIAWHSLVRQKNSITLKYDLSIFKNSKNKFFNTFYSQYKGKNGGDRMRMLASESYCILHISNKWQFSCIITAASDESEKYKKDKRMTTSPPVHRDRHSKCTPADGGGSNLKTLKRTLQLVQLSYYQSILIVRCSRYGLTYIPAIPIGIYPRPTRI